MKFRKLLHSTKESIQGAFAYNFPDYKDALINSLVETHSMDSILTNNISDFIPSPLPVYRPVDFIALFG